VSDVVSIVKRDPSAQSIEIGIEGNDLSASVDAEMVRATVLNLLLNAAQATAGKGRILVTLGQSDGRAVIEVRDSGPGIPVEIRDRVFEPFFTTKARGGGLGLPIARRTAELHGGTLSYDCPADGGTIVTLTLPVTPVRARAESA
jgi:signal transduction histidine kinase